MRSRNGNRPFLLSGIAVIATLSFGAEHYYIGYRLATKNAQPVHEAFTLSKAMRPCPLLQGPALTLLRLTDEPLQQVLEREKNSFIEYALADSTRIDSHGRIHDGRAQTLETLTLPTQCYAVDFNDDSVTISVLK